MAILVQFEIIVLPYNKIANAYKSILLFQEYNGVLRSINYILWAYGKAKKNVRYFMSGNALMQAYVNCVICKIPVT